MHNRNTKWTALCSETDTLLISWVCSGSTECSRVPVPGTSGCLKAPTIMGSTKQHHRVQRVPGSLQQWSLLQPTTGIKSQLHTSVKAKHYRPSAALLPFQGGTHQPCLALHPGIPNLQGPDCWSLAPHWAHSTARALTKHTSTLPEVSHCSSCPGTQGGIGSTSHPPVFPQLHFLCIRENSHTRENPICSRNKGREWLAVPFCISCFPLSALTSDAHCHILYFMWNAVTSSCLTQAMANFLLQISCEGAWLCNSPGSKSDRLQQSQPKTRERAQRNYRGWERKCYIHNKIF